MSWTCEMLEDVLNYIRVNYHADRVFFLDLDADRIGFWIDKDTCKIRKISEIHQKMIDRQKEIMI